MADIESDSAIQNVTGGRRPQQRRPRGLAARHRSCFAKRAERDRRASHGHRQAHVPSPDAAPGTPTVTNITSPASRASIGSCASPRIRRSCQRRRILTHGGGRHGYFSGVADIPGDPRWVAWNGRRLPGPVSKCFPCRTAGRNCFRSTPEACTCCELQPVSTVQAGREQIKAGHVDL